MTVRRTAPQRWISSVRAVWQEITPAGWRRASLVERNIRHLYGEIGWVAILAGIVTFNAAYALRLGATNVEIGLLSALPALVAILVTIPSGSILALSRRRMVPLLTWSLFINRIGYLLVALVPLLARSQAAAAIAILVIFSAPGHFYNVGWNALIADVTPEESRAHVIATRSILWSVVSTVSIFVAGRWLTAVRFPDNYQWLYLVGFMTSMISLYHVSRIQPCQPCQDEPPAEPVGLAHAMADLLPAIRKEPQFVRFVINTIAYNIGLWLVGPVYVLYFVRTLDVNEAWLGLNGTVATLAPIAGLYFWQRVITRRGDNPILKRTVMLLGLYPLLIGLTRDPQVILIWTALYGLIAPAVSLSHFSVWIKVIPEDQRPGFMAVYITATNIGAFVLPLLGALMVERLSPGPTLIIGGALSVVGASLFRLRPVRVPDARVP